MNKAQIKAAIKQYLDGEIEKAKYRLSEFAPMASNPQVALMIEKNKGYLMAMEDVADVVTKTK